MSGSEYEDSGPEDQEDLSPRERERPSRPAPVPKIAVRDGEDQVDGMKFKDKASFREQSAAFHKVLSDSSRYRRGNNLPEPGSQSPRRLDGLSPRPEGGYASPRSPRDRQGLLNRGQPRENNERYPENSRPRVVDLDNPIDLDGSSEARRGGRKELPSFSGGAPLRGQDRNKLNDIECHSPRPGDISARIKLSAVDSRSAPNSPRMSKGSPLIAKKNNTTISLDDATSSLRESRRSRLDPIGKWDLLGLVTMVTLLLTIMHCGSNKMLFVLKNTVFNLMVWLHIWHVHWYFIRVYSISQEFCTRFALIFVLSWFDIGNLTI